MKRAPLFPPCIVYTIVQAVVSIVLVWYATVTPDATLSTVIITAVVTHWVKEAPQMGQMMFRGIGEWQTQRQEDRQILAETNRQSAQSAQRTRASD